MPLSNKIKLCLLGIMIGTAMAQEGNAHPGLSIPEFPEFRRPQFISRFFKTVDQYRDKAKKAVQTVQEFTDEDMERIVVESTEYMVMVPHTIMKNMYNFTKPSASFCVAYKTVDSLWE